MDQIQLYEIIGIVKNVKPLDKGSLFYVASVSTQREHQVTCTYFCPARKGDVISGYCMQEKMGLSFIQNPVVEPPSSKDAVQTAFIVAMGRGNRLNKYMADRLYDYFQQEALNKIEQYKHAQEGTSESTIYRNRDLLSAAVMETISYYASKFRTNPDFIQPLLNIGITKEQAEALMRWWHRSHTMRRLYLLGLTRKEILEACDRGWPGTQLLASPDALYYQLLENPFLIETLPMEKAQSIATRYRRSFGQDMIESADLVRFVDRQTQENGWACYPVYTLMQRYPRYAELEPVLKRDYKCCIRYNFFYLRYQTQVEDILVEHLQSFPLKETHVCQKTKEKLCEEQIQAVEMALNNTVSVITGAGGTGKSSTIGCIEQELQLRNIQYLVASFTGKAVSRLKEVLSNPNKALTMHMILSRALEYSDNGEVQCEYLIVDEVSMIPNELLAKVLCKLSNSQPPGRKLKVVLVGDPEQVQPIEWGDLFNQILISGVVPRVHLQQDHRRQDQDGVLFENMRQFATCEDPSEIQFRWGKDCEHIPGNFSELSALLQTIQSDHRQITIVSPYERNLDEINQICMSIFVPPGTPSVIDKFGKTWKIGARVMMTKNRYDIKVMNGEEGIVIGVNEHYIDVRFKQGQEVKIPTFVPIVSEEDEEEQPLSTKLLVLSWAVTIHKSQGSEWNNVIFYLPPNMGRSSFFNRKLLGTGIGRARGNLYVLCLEKSMFEQAIYINPPKRYDNLARRLQNEPYVDHYVDPARQKYLELTS